jgi:hypothetical protein
MTEGLTIEYSGTHRRHRIRFKKRDAGGWHRIEETYRPSHSDWHTVGEKIVAALVVEDSADVTTSIPL